MLKEIAWAGIAATAIALFGAGIVAGIIVERVLESRRAKCRPADVAAQKFEEWSARNASVIDKWFAAYRPTLGRADDEMLTRLLTRNDIPRC